MVKREDMKRLSDQNHVHNFLLEKTGEDVDLAESYFNEYKLKGLQFLSCELLFTSYTFISCALTYYS